MTTYFVTSANWNDPAFWSAITSAPGDALDFDGLSSAYTIDFNASTGLLSITNGGTTFTVGDSTFGGAPDVSLSGASELADFDIAQTTDGSDTVTTGSRADFVNIAGDAGEDVVSTGAGEDTIEFGNSRVTVDGGADDDTFIRSGGTNTSNAGSLIDGGAGTDTFEIDGDNGSFFNTHHVDLSSGNLFFGSLDRGTLTNFENVTITNAAVRVTGDAGNNAITATGVHDNVLAGGAGSDTIDAGDGNDSITGGTGADTLIGGGGADTFFFADGSGSDVITDFSIGDGDQLDVSGQTNALGDPVHAWNITTVDDGSGNAKLIFPSGDEIILQGVTPAQMSTPAQYQAAGIPCFVAGTLILTPHGEVPVESLRPGDQVVTRDNGVQPILWAASRSLGPQELALSPHLRPVEIKAGALHDNRRLMVSPQHGVLLTHDTDEKLVRATHLARLKGGRIRHMKGVRRVTYHHILFETHQIVFSNGIPSESFYPGPLARRAVEPDAALELNEIFPDLILACRQQTRREYGKPSRIYASWNEVTAEHPRLRRLH